MTSIFHPVVRRVTEFLHQNDDEYSDLWPVGAKQQEKFSYRLYEVEITLEVDMETGETRIVAVQGIPLQLPTKWG